MSSELLAVPFVTQHNLVRLEVQRPVSDSEAPAEDSVSWNLYAAEPAEDEYLQAGILLGRNDEILGQAMVTSRLKWITAPSKQPELSDVLHWAYLTQVEAMYDICRRALEMQAALMDDTFDFPYEAPEAAFEHTTKRPKGSART